MIKKIGSFIFVLFIISLMTVTIAGCGPKPPLTITISQPTDGAAIIQSPYQVRGNVSDPKATVTVNGVKAAMTPKGFYGANITLTQGENTINVVATRGEESVTKTMTVTYSSKR